MASRTGPPFSALSITTVLASDLDRPDVTPFFSHYQYLPKIQYALHWFLGVQGRGTGWCVWDGAVVLARYMEAASRVDDASQQAAIPCAAVCSPTHCIELGAGTGLAGLSAAQAFQVTRSHKRT